MNDDVKFRVDADVSHFAPCDIQKFNVIIA